MIKKVSKLASKQVGANTEAKQVSKSASGQVETNGFQKLRVWQRGQDLTVAVYQVTGRFPKEEVFGITSQLRRAILSVPTNIAESQGRFSYADRINFLTMARGSLHEARSLIDTSSRLGFLTKKAASNLESEMSGLTTGINGLIKSMRSR